MMATTTGILLPFLFLVSLTVTIAAVDKDDHNSPVALFPADGLRDDYIRYNLENFKKFGTYIGIDIGNTYTRVGIERNGVLEIIPNGLGHKKTHNWISFTPNGTLIAGDQVTSLNTNPLFDVKRLVGRGFDHPEVQRAIQVSPYKIVNRQGKPFVQVNMVGGETKVFDPEDLFAALLGNIKDMAENYLRKRIRKAILTVPDSYEFEYQFAVNRVAARVGFSQTQAVGHSTAAVVAHELHDRVGERKYVVFRLSGGTCEVHVVGCENGYFESLARKGDTNLGGQEFDRRLMSHFVGLIRKKYGRDTGEDMTAFERAKIALSSRKRVMVEIKSLNLSVLLTRAVFEEINLDLFDKITGLVEAALEEAGVTKADIDGILLVGGSTKIPKVQKLLRDLFDGKVPIISAGHVNPEDLLVKGALVLSHPIRLSLGHMGYRRYIVPVSAGIRTVGGVMTKLVRRNTFVPTLKKAVFTTNRDNQTTLEIKLLIGEMRSANDCCEITTFNLSGIPPAPRGVPRIEISFGCDSNYRFDVRAEDKASNVSVSNYFYLDEIIEKELDRILEESVEKEDRMYWVTTPKTPHFIIPQNLVFH